MPACHFMNAAGAFKRLEKIIEEATDSAFSNILHFVPEQPIDIVFRHNPEYIIPETGIGGTCETPHLIHITLDTTHPDLEKVIKYELPSTLAHEYHHALRENVLGGNAFLADALVSEGLADHFDQMVFSTALKPWCRALSDKKIHEMKERATKCLYRSGYNENTYISWFMGDRGQHIPRWTGYTIGYSIVGTYLDLHPNATPANLYSTPTRQIIDSIWSQR